MTRAVVKLFHEPDSHTGQYVVHCPDTKEAAIIDSVSVFDPIHGTLKFVRNHPATASEVLAEDD